MTHSSRDVEGAIQRVNLQCETLTKNERLRVACLDCDWLGLGIQLKAQTCPLCDGRVLNIDYESNSKLTELLRDLVKFEEQINIDGILPVAESDDLHRIAHDADIILCDL